MLKSFVKMMLPQKLIYFVTFVKVWIDLRFVSIMGRWRKSADLYYLFSSAFSNEHKAVLQGRKGYHASLINIGETSALLRRNTHRLEKGLIMRPRRSVFAEGFIQETVECYSDAVCAPRLSESEKKWATDVLDEYFRIVGFTRVIDKARADYTKARCNSVPINLHHKDSLPDLTTRYMPYVYNQLPDANVSFTELKQLFVRRRSVRWYQDRLVPLAVVQKAANAASLAPSACNRQPYRFIFCNKPEQVVAIASCAAGTSGYAANLPAIIAVVGDLSAYPFERDRHLIYIDGSLAAMQLMLALETLGLSSCPINWPEVDTSERKIRKIINLKGYEKIVMLLAVGYADKDGGIPYSQKKMHNLILEDISK